MEITTEVRSGYGACLVFDRVKIGCGVMPYPWTRIDKYHRHFWAQMGAVCTFHCLEHWIIQIRFMWLAFAVKFKYRGTS